MGFQCCDSYLGTYLPIQLVCFNVYIHGSINDIEVLDFIFIEQFPEAPSLIVVIADT